MKRKVNICTEEWCNMVFEGKNKNYGAFELRQMSSKRHTLAILLSVTFFTLSISAPVLIKKFSPPGKKIYTESTTIAEINVEKLIEKPLIEPPQPKLRRTIQFVPPVITSDPTEENAPPINDVVMNSTAAIDYRTQDGDDLAPPKTFQATEEIVEPVRFVPQMPEFIGGEEARLQFLRDHLKYPNIAAEMGITGKVILQFVVNKDGMIDKVTVLRGIGGGCDEEAMRVAKLMPPWKPGRQNGKPVPVYFIMPIGFTLQTQ